MKGLPKRKVGNVVLERFLAIYWNPVDNSVHHLELLAQDSREVVGIAKGIEKRDGLLLSCIKNWFGEYVCGAPC